MKCFGIVQIVSVTLLISLTGSCATTPPITDDDGEPMAGSVATRELVTLNGRRHGLVIRGYDRRAPILLWVAGGPGGSELGWTTTYLGDLEQDFVFVNWDQPGVGMSYRSFDWRDATVDQFVDDLISLSEYLIQRFERDRIVLIGHSWGSIIGLMAVSRRPDLFEVYVGVGQQINAVENDLHGYNMVLRRAHLRGDDRVVSRLRDNGPPPYTQEHGERYLYLFQKVHVYSPQIAPEPRFGTMVFPREYTIRDSVNLVRGLVEGVRYVYPQLVGFDFERDVPRLGIPVYFFTGRYDETCVQDIAWRYFVNLDAPHKEFVWFENSGHNVPFQESDRFMQELRERILESPSHRRSL